MHQLPARSISALTSPCICPAAVLDASIAGCSKVKLCSPAGVARLTLEEEVLALPGSHLPGFPSPSQWLWLQSRNPVGGSPPRELGATQLVSPWRAQEHPDTAADTPHPKPPPLAASLANPTIPQQTSPRICWHLSTPPTGTRKVCWGRAMYPYDSLVSGLLIPASQTISGPDHPGKFLWHLLS